MINYKYVLSASAAATFSRPIIENIICPYFKGYSETLDNICTAAVIATSIVPVVIGTSLTLSSICQQHSLNSLFAGVTSNAVNLALPAGLGMVAAKIITNGHEIPLPAFAIGTVKSSFEISAIGAIINTINPGGSLGDLTVLGYTITNKVLYSGLVAISVAAATNTMFYLGSDLVKGKELSTQSLYNATDYALGYSIARPFYQVGTHFLDLKENAIGTVCMFTAPVFRGYVLGVLERGSVTVPGSNYGIVSNVVDGAAIALASLTRSEVAKLDIFKVGDLSKIGAGNTVTAVLLSIIGAHKIYDNYESIMGKVSESLELAYSNAIHIFESVGVLGNATATDEL